MVLCTSRSHRTASDGGTMPTQSCICHTVSALFVCCTCRNYALENAMEAANLPLVELMDRSAATVGASAHSQSACRPCRQTSGHDWFQSLQQWLVSRRLFITAGCAAVCSRLLAWPSVQPVHRQQRQLSREAHSSAHPAAPEQAVLPALLSICSWVASCKGCVLTCAGGAWQMLSA